MVRFLILIVAALFVVPAHAQQLKGVGSQQITCLQAYAFFAPDAPETRALHDEMIAKNTWGSAASVDHDRQEGLERLHDALARDDSILTKVRDALPACASIIGMPAPAVAADAKPAPIQFAPVSLPAADGGVARCAMLFRSFEMAGKEGGGPGTQKLNQKMGEEIGKDFYAAKAITDDNARIFFRPGYSGTSVKALVVEALDCATRYDALVPQTVLEQAKDVKVAPGAPLIKFCDDMMSYFELNYPRPTSFLSQLRNHHMDDARDFILKKGYGVINFYRHPMTLVACPASYMNIIDQREAEFSAALEAYAPEFNAAAAREARMKAEASEED